MDFVRKTLATKCPDFGVEAMNDDNPARLTAHLSSLHSSGPFMTAISTRA